MNQLASLGIILLFALLAGHLVKVLRIPEVTGYILAGVAVGPSVLGWINHENLLALSVFSEVTLGLILFSIGSVFEFSRVRRLGPAVLRITLLESLLAGVLVAGAALALGQAWQVALLLGAIAMETGAASTLMVIRECNGTGPLTETLLGVIGVNNVLCLSTFYLVASFLDVTRELSAGGPLLETLYRSGYPLIWQLVGSVALGYLVGLLLATWATKVVEHGETVILLVGCVLLCVGLAAVLELSPLIASLAFGATMANLSAQSRQLLGALSQTDPPFYAIFFVIAGADLNLALLPSMGALGVAYLLGRGAGKMLGARIGAGMARLKQPVRGMLGLGVLAHAGLAVGLSLSISRRFPEHAPAVVTVVLAVVTVYEMIGPVAARQAILRSGEARAEAPQSPAVGELLS